MSIKQMALVWEHEFTANELLVMLALADHANDEGGSIYPALGRVAWKTGLSRRTVQRYVSDLRKRKVLKIVKHAEDSTPNEYRIQWQYAEKKPPYMGGRQSDTPGGVDTGVQGGVTQVSTKPSVNHHLATLEETFNQASHIPIPEDWPMRQKRWRTPLKRMHSMAGEQTCALIEQTVRQMRQDKLTISAPQSIEKVFTDIYARQQEKPEMDYA